MTLASENVRIRVYGPLRQADALVSDFYGFSEAAIRNFTTLQQHALQVKPTPALNMHVLSVFFNPTDSLARSAPSPSLPFPFALHTRSRPQIFTTTHNSKHAEHFFLQPHLPLR